MPVIRHTNTTNIKPASINTLNIVPNYLNTVNYAAAFTLSSSRKFGTFKFGEKQFGTTTETSAGQRMPVTNTREV